MIHLPLCNKQLKVVGTAGLFFFYHGFDCSSRTGKYQAGCNQTDLTLTDCITQ